MGAHTTLTSLLNYFAKAKVCDAKVAILVNQYIFWFEVAVENALLMHVFESQYDLSCVELGPVFRESV